MVLVTRQAPDFTSSAVLGNGEIVDNFNFKKHIAGKAAVIFFYPLDLFLSTHNSLTMHGVTPQLKMVVSAKLNMH